MAEAQHPFMTMEVPYPERGRQYAWEARFDGRKGYGVYYGEYYWNGTTGPARTMKVQRTAGQEASDLTWGHDVFPSEAMALLAAEFKNDLLVTLITQRNQQHIARLIELGYKQGDLIVAKPCDAPFFLEGTCSNCGFDADAHAARKSRLYRCNSCGRGAAEKDDGRQCYAAMGSGGVVCAGTIVPLVGNSA